MINTLYFRLRIIKQMLVIRLQPYAITRYYHHPLQLRTRKIFKTLHSNEPFVITYIIFIGALLLLSNTIGSHIGFTKLMLK